MNIQRLLAICFAGLLSLATLTAQEQLSLSDAIQLGLVNNYQIQIAEQNVAIAENNNDWAVAGRYPSVNLSLNLNNSHTRINNPASFLRELQSTSSGFVPGVNATWTLFDGYRVQFTKERLAQLEEQAQGNVRIAVENTIEQIILAYYLALAQQEQLAVLEEVLTLSRDRVAYQEVKREFGQAGTFDVLQTQDAYLNDSTSYLVQLNSYQNALRSLNLAMGVDDLSQRYVLTDQLEFEGEDYDLEAMQTRMLANNQELRNLQINRELAGVNTRLQEANRWPTVSLEGGATYNSNRNLSGTGVFADGSERDLGSIQSSTLNGFLNVRASYNLFNGGVRQKNIDNAKVQEVTAQLSIEDRKRQLSALLANTLATYNNEKELVEVTNQLLENARRNLEIAEERFRGGLINSFDYRTIQLSYISATQQRLTAVFNLKTTETELIRLMGGLVR